MYAKRKIGEYLQALENHEQRTIEQLTSALKVGLENFQVTVSDIKIAVRDMIETNKTVGFNLKILNKDGTRNVTVDDIDDENTGGKVLLQYTAKYKNIRRKEDILNLNARLRVMIIKLEQKYTI